ncbi:MAG TPA: diguanylate cyclase [Terracidiphilus sp.]|jgi:diguanylate cyclase (GGDEF)-like protein/PAS domain S-box-containing protein
MSERTELLEATLEGLREGVAVFDAQDRVAWWNHAAEAITGYPGMDLLARPVPEVLEGLLLEGARMVELGPGGWARAGHGTLARVKHRLGHEVVVMARTVVLRDGLGGRIGTTALFRPAETLDALPRGDTGDDADVAASQMELEDRLDTEFGDFRRGGPPFGLLWIGVDQAHELRRTHGTGACHAMLEKLHRALSGGLRPSEQIGRWGEDEFLVIAHERTAEMLALQAQTLAGMARTTDFRWWGDRLSITVSIGAGQADAGCDATLAQLLERTQQAMVASRREGGNRIASAGRGKKCLPL